MPYKPNFRNTDSSTWTARWPPVPNDPTDPEDQNTFIRFLENVPGSPLEELRNDGSQVVRTVFVDWDDRFAASYLLCGYPMLETNPNNQRQYISRNLPMPHQDFLVDDKPGEFFLWCDQVQKCEGWGTPTGAGAQIPTDEMAAELAKATGDDPTETLEQAAFNAGKIESSQGSPDFAEMFNAETITPIYRFAKLALLFKSYVYGIVSDEMMPRDQNGNPDESTLQRYVILTTSSGDQYLTLPQGGFNYINVAGTKKTVLGQPGIIVPQDTCILRWLQVPLGAVSKRLYNPAPYFKNYPLDDYRGCVNLSTFLGQPPGCVLFTSAVAEPCVSAFGNLLYTVILNFRVFNPGLDSDGRPIGHNHLYAIDSGAPNGHAGYFEVVTGNGTNIVIQGPVGDQTNVGPGAMLPDDYANIFNWRELNDLMRIPQLGP